jgi:hypothetical protein
MYAPAVVYAAQVGVCRLECGTMVRMCEDIVVKNKEAIKELIVNKTPKPELERKICNELSSACVTLPPPYTGNRQDEEFKEADEEELEMMQTMAKMEQQGMSGTVCSLLVLPSLFLCVFALECNQRLDDAGCGAFCHAHFSFLVPYYCQSLSKWHVICTAAGCAIQVYCRSRIPSCVLSFRTLGVCT